MINIIAAMDQKGLIGSSLNDAHTLPFRNRDDLTWFKNLTESHIVAMGKNTAQSLSGALDGRTNIILSSNQNISLIKDLGSDRTVWVIGGEAIYSQAIGFADNLFLTQFIDLDYRTRFEKHTNSEDYLYNYFPQVPDFYYYNLIWEAITPLQQVNLPIIQCAIFSRLRFQIFKRNTLLSQ